MSEEKPTVKISPWHGDVHALIEAVMPVLKKFGRRKKAEEMLRRIKREGIYSYPNAFRIAKEYVILKY